MGFVEVDEDEITVWGWIEIGRVPSCSGDLTRCWRVAIIEHAISVYGLRFRFAVDIHFDTWVDMSGNKIKKQTSHRLSTL